MEAHLPLPQAITAGSKSTVEEFFLYYTGLCIAGTTGFVADSISGCGLRTTVPLDFPRQKGACGIRSQEKY